jgi:hypothetical protein
MRYVCKWYEDLPPWALGAGYDSSGSQLTDRRWIYDYDAWAEAAALTRTR